MIEDSLKITGKLDVILKDAFGNVKQHVHIPNLVVTAGKNAIAQRLGADHATGAYAPMSHMGVGSDSTAPANGDTDLGSIIGSRVVITSTSVSNNVVTYSATWDAGVSTGAITEAGIFNASTGSTMLCRTTFAVVNKLDPDILTINWTITIN